MPNGLAERTAKALEPKKALLGKITLACGISMVVVGFPAQIYSNWQNGECGIDPILIGVALLLYLVRIPYQASARAWYLLPADVIGLLASVVLMAQWIHYDTDYTTKDVFNVLAGFVFVLAFVPYIIATVRKDTDESPIWTTWLIWATLDSITLTGVYQEKAVDHLTVIDTLGAVNGSLLGAVVGAWIVTVLSVIYGKSRWTLLEKFCLAGAGLGIYLLFVLDNPTIAIAVSLSVVFIGSIPTINSARKDPTKENKLAWTMYWVACICGLIAIPAMTVEDAAQPITFFAVESIMMYTLFVRPRMLRE